MKETTADETDRDKKSIFVKNVHFSANQAEIEEHFRSSGKVLSTTILKDKFSK